MKIKVLHLYYDIMNLYGEYANVLILESHLKDQGIKVLVDKKTIKDKINFSKYDFIYMGCGTEREALFILEDLRKYKKELKKYIENNGFILFTGNSYEILGKKFYNEDGLNILDFNVTEVKTRITSDAIFKCDFIEEKVIGFINNSSSITNNTNHLFKVVNGKGENKKSNYEGIKYKNLYTTHLIGPLLVRNPALTKYLVTELLKSKDKNFEYKEIDYYDEQESYKIALQGLSVRKNLEVD